jgi:EAL domain-containing protein (putative c-di-GMP-specific phosphodiesterase class I)/FixJ family two-component response regulator
MRVLIFDDDAAIGRLVVRVAAVAGIDALAVIDAETFARELKNNPPQLILLDLQLSDTDGVEQLRHLSETQYKGSVVLMSGFDGRVLGTASALGQSLGLKVEGVLEKPLRVTDLERLFERVQSAGHSPTIERLLLAIMNDELSLDFQPVVTRDPRNLKKLEALVRWDHPVLGRILPAEFIPVAESDPAAIDALTEWVMRAAVEAYQVLGAVGIVVPLAVNVSPRNLQDAAFPDRVTQDLRDGGMPARHLCLEITETAVFTDPTLTMDILTRLRLKGIELSIDDFGTGYSSMKMLREMPFTEIKIDRSFIKDLTTSRDSRVITKSIMDLAANMKMSCVAEGIETEDTAATLEQMGVCGLQGYFIGRPMPVEAVHPWLTTWLRPERVPDSTEFLIPPAARDALTRNEYASTPQSARPGVAGVTPRLSPRQTEVMQLLSQGLSVKGIARHMNLGVGTVKIHLSQAYSSLGAHNRVEAVMRAGLYTTLAVT